VQVPLRFCYLFALEPIYLNIKGIDLLLIIIERLEYTLPLFWTRPVKPRLITYQLLFDATTSSLWLTAPPSFWCHRWLRSMPLWMLSLMLPLLLRSMPLPLLLEGEGGAQLIIRMCVISLCHSEGLQIKAVRYQSLDSGRSELDWNSWVQSQKNNHYTTYVRAPLIHVCCCSISLNAFWELVLALHKISHPAVNKTVIKLF